jgi:hypothetical protein
MDFGLLLLLAGLVFIGSNCRRDFGHLPVSFRIDAINAGRLALEMFDADKDGKISGPELDKCPGLKAGLARLDPAHQGVTAEMIDARIGAWKDSKLGRSPIMLRFTHNGKPLVDAVVKLVPEKFLGREMFEKCVAKGKTEASGTVMLSIDLPNPRDPPGVYPGYYRIEVTKAGMNIPSKYNTETALGIEVAQDAPEMLQGGSIEYKVDF